MILDVDKLYPFQVKIEVLIIRIIISFWKCTAELMSIYIVVHFSRLCTESIDK